MGTKKRFFTTLCPVLLMGLFPPSGPIALSANRPDQQDAGSDRTALVLANVTVIDATGAPAQPDMTVVVRGGRIEALGSHATLEVPANAQIVDAAGKFLIPGLWDMHVHPFYKDCLPLFIANGVTGIRVMSGEPMHHQWREAISAGQFTGPRMAITSAILEGPNGSFSWPVATNQDEGRQFVRKAKKDGADFVKIGIYLPRDAYYAVADEARKQRIPLVGEVPFSVTLAETADAGQRSVEHTPFVLFASSAEGEESLRKKARATRTPKAGPEGKRARYKLLADIVYSEKEATRVFTRLVENGTWVCPTLIAHSDLLSGSEQDSANDPRLKYIPLTYRQLWENEVRVAGGTGEARANLEKVCAKQRAIVGAMGDARVGLLAGTDTFTPGFDLQDELALFVEAGLSPLEALQTATLNPARFLGRLDSTGTIGRGKRADLVLLEANPLEDIRNTKRIAAVVVGGRIFDKTALQKMLARAEASPLHQAAADGKLERVKSLVSAGADVNVRHIDRETPLHYAVRRGHKEIAEVLLDHGADVNIGAENNITAAEYAMDNDHTEIVQVLVSRGADVSPLHLALYVKDQGRARSLIEGGADVNRRTPNGTTPLDRAVGAGFKDIVELLVAKGADVNARGNWGWTPLHSAVYGHKDIVELLLAKGADVDARDGSGRTPLAYALNEGHTEIVDLLRQHEPKE